MIFRIRIISPDADNSETDANKVVLCGSFMLFTMPVQENFCVMLLTSWMTRLRFQGQFHTC